MPATVKRPRCLPLLAALLALAVSPRASVGAEPRPPRLAVDPLPSIVEQENHTSALSRWYSRGYRKAVLVHIDTKDGMRPLGAKPAAALAEIGALPPGTPVPAYLAEAARHGRFEASFLRAAAALGIVREAYWVMPFDYFRVPDPAGALRADLKHAGYAEEDLRTFTLRDQCFRGTVGGMPFTVCGLEALPPIAEPVLVSVNPDFLLSRAAAVPGSNPIKELKSLLAALAARRYGVLDVVVPVAPPAFHWVGETIAQALRDPTLLERPESSKRLTLLQTLAGLQQLGDYAEMMHQAWPYLALHEDDPALQLAYAEALTGLGKLEDALAHAETACRLHQGYCFGLPWIGVRLLSLGHLEAGEHFFAAAARLRPDLPFGQLARGLLLQEAGRRPEALRAFLGLSDRGDAFPAGFLAGALQLQLGDRAGARRQFDRAVEALRDESEAEVTNEATAQAIREAARLYREEGLAAQAQALEQDPRLVFRPGEAPPGPP